MVTTIMMWRLVTHYRMVVIWYVLITRNTKFVAIDKTIFTHNSAVTKFPTNKTMICKANLLSSSQLPPFLVQFLQRLCRNFVG